VAIATDNGALSRQELSRMSFIAGFILVEFVFLLLFLGAIALILGSTIEAYQAWSALLISIATPFFLVRSHDLAQRFPPIVYSLLFLGFVGAGLLVSAHFFDVTYDGQAYHQEAIIQLAQGWNPDYETLSPDIAGWIWVTHYSKGTWIAAASLYEMTGHIECGKLPNLLLIGATFFICASVLFRIEALRPSLAIVVSLLLAFNPISAHQSLGFCVDGQLSSLFISLIAVLTYQFLTQNAAARLLTVFLVITLVNVKFTAVPYTLVIGAGFVIASISWKKLYQVRAVLLHACAAFVVGVVVVGYNTYVTNTLKNGNPFYPLIGSGSIDAISEFTPPNFGDHSRVERLFLSVFGTTSRDSDKPSELKVPFTITRDEVVAFATPNVKIGGWGPLFGGAMLLTLFGLAASLASPGALRLMAPYLFVIVTVLTTALVHGVAWWARFAPQLWLIPTIGAVMLVQTNSRITRYAGHVLLLVLLLNVALVGGSYALFQNKFTNELSSQLHSIAREHTPIDVYFGEMQSNRIRLREAGIAYRDRATPTDLTCSTKSSLSHSATLFCGAAQ
jgi:hypothetical protein